MIDKALKFLTDEMNSYLDLQNGNPPGESLIVLTNVANADGTWAIPDKKLGVSLINIEEERVFKDQQSEFRNINGDYEKYNPEIKLNLYMLICSHWVSTQTDPLAYEDGLKQLSRIVSFFQGKNVFTPDNSPSMDPALQKLVVDLYSYSFEQQYNFWSILGAKYLPSALYKVRLLAYQEKRVQNQNEAITSFSLNLSNI
jgi:hypothetical protein